MIYPRLLTRFGMLFFVTDLSLVKFQVRYLALFLLLSVIDSCGCFWMGRLHKNKSWSSSRVHSWSYAFLPSINDLPDDVICNIAIYAGDATFYSKCDQASDLWQQLEWAFELEPDLQDTMDWGRKWLVNFNVGKAQLILLDRSNNAGAIDVKIDGLLLRKKHLRCWGVHFSSKLD